MKNKNSVQIFIIIVLILMKNRNSVQISNHSTEETKLYRKVNS